MRSNIVSQHHDLLISIFQDDIAWAIPLQVSTLT